MRHLVTVQRVEGLDVMRETPTHLVSELLRVKTAQRNQLSDQGEKLSIGDHRYSITKYHSRGLIALDSRRMRTVVDGDIQHVGTVAHLIEKKVRELPFNMVSVAVNTSPVTGHTYSSQATMGISSL